MNLKQLFKTFRERYMTLVTVALICSLISSGIVVKLLVSHDGYAEGSVASETAKTGATGKAAPVSIRDSSAVIGKNTVADIVEKVSPAVVYISTETKPQQKSGTKQNEQRRFPEGWEDFFDNFGGFSTFPPPSYTGTGSGFVISDDGYIYTNYHVVENATTIKVEFSDGKKLDAKVTGYDKDSDLAILKVEAKNLPTLTLGDSSKVRPGEWVIAIGNPLGFSHTVTVGIISAVGRSRDGNPNGRGNWLQTDAAINPGNSGGPLLDLNGKVIGINTAIIQNAQGIGFAIPVNTAKSIMNDLIEKGKVVRPWLGVRVSTLSPEAAKYYGLEETSGVLVGEVTADSPADKAGLKANDVIKEIDRKVMKTNQDVVDYVRSKKIGDSVQVLVSRDNELKVFTVKLGEMPQE